MDVKGKNLLHFGGISAVEDVASFLLQSGPQLSKWSAFCTVSPRVPRDLLTGYRGAGPAGAHRCCANP